MNDSQQQQIEAVFRLPDRPVWIVTSAANGRRGGLVATWILQASIDPTAPLVVAGLAPNHFTAQLVDAGGAFALHLLAKSQIELIWNFAIGSGQDRDKLAGLSTTTGDSGAPILRDCLAWLDCRVVTRYDGGDRWYFWADVLSGGQNLAGDQNLVGGQTSAEPPLTEAAVLAAASPEQKQALLANMLADRQTQRPLRTLWRQNVSNPQAC